MIEIKSKKDYYKSLIKSSLWIVVGFLIIQIINPSFFFGTLIIFLVIEAILISENFTQSISVDALNVKIINYHFFSKKEIVIERNKVEFKLLKKASFRSPGYFVLDVLENKKRIYTIDSRNGFEEEELIKLNDFLKPKNAFN
ncbi:hypothetical protein [Parafilimonas sp.]|uniref:hypothetical protein n=1 Tax=Parafilimonas sp. TaxID=1969739 RepID=UPI0039E63D07